ncbi:MAG: hypothetical protein ACREFP_01715 [Acetobacteraceae bacterium]
MARPKKYAERTVVAFADGTFDAIAEVLAPAEDRSDFVREAVALTLSVRSGDFYPDLRHYLLSGETLASFCANAIRRAVEERKRALADIGVEPAIAPSHVPKTRHPKRSIRKTTHPQRQK